MRSILRSRSRSRSSTKKLSTHGGSTTELEVSSNAMCERTTRFYVKKTIHSKWNLCVRLGSQRRAKAKRDVSALLEERKPGAETGSKVIDWSSSDTCACVPPWQMQTVTLPTPPSLAP